MHIASLVLLVLAVVGVVAALFPCIGWLNWVAGPFCIVPLLIAVIGMITDKDPETQQSRNMGIYIATVIVSLLLMVVSIVRCALGGFVL